MKKSKKLVIKVKQPRGSKVIQQIYNRFGGTRRAAKICGYSAELLSNWKRSGKVPLKKVAEISKALNCSPFNLNSDCQALYDICAEYALENHLGGFATNDIG